ncbi:hypothetical protein CEK28_08445 [Xenophilus sp. AP218F]|nr:hypothetical protein CEK28_08445 [Xenophilus sp. AP218F]
MHVTLQSVAQEVSRGLAACPDFVAFRQVVRATQELCSRARIWSGWAVARSSPLSPVADIEGPWPFGILAGVLKVTLADGTELERIPDKIARWKHPRESADGKSPRYYSISDMMKIYLSPKPAIDTELFVLSYFMPSYTGEAPPSLLQPQVCEAIQHGARYYLFNEPGQPWANPQQAAWHKAQFESAIESLRTQSDLTAGGGRVRSKAQFL